MQPPQEFKNKMELQQKNKVNTGKSGKGGNMHRIKMSQAETK
jgi:hypothetical protein